jgi:hypothetical protein
MNVQNVQKNVPKKFKKKLGEGRVGTGENHSGEGGELSFQCLRPSTALRDAGKKSSL